MSIRQTKPFKVEIKGKRRRPLWSAAILQAEHEAHDVPADALGERLDRPHTAAIAAAEKTFRRPGAPAWTAGVNGTEPAQALASVVEAAAPQAKTEAANGPRILPDLRSEDPLEVRLRQEAEERAARRRGPRGPRRKTAEGASRTEARPSPKRSAAARKSAPARRPAAERAAAKAPAPALAVPQRISRSNPGTAEVAPSNGKSRGRHNPWAHRKACRKAKRAGLPQPLRVGERWKRRLPQSCW